MLSIFFIILLSTYLLITAANILKEENNANTPSNDTPPPIPDTPSDIPKSKIAELLNKEYMPSQDVYSNPTKYNLEALKILIDGEFNSIIIHIQGQVKKEGIHFLSVNFGTESGILNAVRNSANTLDIEATRKKGGVFNTKNPIDIKINLLGETSMATTREEFQRTLQSTKVVQLWEKMALAPPTVTRLLIAPFNEKGIYGGATINSIEAEYSCKENSKCKITLCPTQSLTTECLSSELDEQAMENWCIRSQKCN